MALVSVGESLGAGSAAGDLVLNVMAPVSEWEREASGERTRDALRHNEPRDRGRETCRSGMHSTATASGWSPLLAFRRAVFHYGSSRKVAAAEILRTRNVAPWHHTCGANPLKDQPQCRMTGPS